MKQIKKELKGIIRYVLIIILLFNLYIKYEWLLTLNFVLLYVGIEICVFTMKKINRKIKTIASYNVFLTNEINKMKDPKIIRPNQIIN